MVDHSDGVAMLIQGLSGVSNASSNGSSRCTPCCNMTTSEAWFTICCKDLRQPILIVAESFLVALCFVTVNRDRFYSEQ